MTRKMTQGMFVIAAALLSVSMVQPSNALDAKAVPPANDSFVEPGIVLNAELDSSEEVIASWPDASREALVAPDDPGPNGPKPVETCCLVNGGCVGSTGGDCDGSGGVPIDCLKCPA